MLQFALRNLLRARVRTLLSLLGVAVSLSIYVVLASVSHGYRSQLDQTVSKCMVDVVVQQRRAATPMNSRIPEQSFTALSTLPGVETATPVVMGGLRTPSIQYLFLIGIPSSGGKGPLDSWLGEGIIAGRAAKPGGKEVMIGHLFAKKHNLWEGDEIALGDLGPCRITGVYTLGMDFLDGGVVTGTESALNLLKRTDGFNIVLLKTSPGAQVTEVLSRINSGFGELSAFPGNRLKDQFISMSLIDSFILAVTTISLVFSGLVVLNTLLMALSERTREIGILMAIGWSRWRVIRMILAEALVLCVAGGILGFALAWVELPLLHYLPKIGAGWLPMTPSWSMLPDVILLSALTALLSALFPALYSTRLSPVSALRKD